MFSRYASDPLFLQTPANSQAQASEIIPGLWIGDAHAAQDAAFFKRHNIEAVVNATPDVPAPFGKEWMRVPVDDNLQQDQIKRMCELLPHAASFLYKNHVLENKSVLVHCHAGIQRSATIVAYYLHNYFGYTIVDAISLIVAKRPVAFFGGKNFNFGACLGLR